MKRIIYSAALLLVTMGGFAQVTIDRSKPPKPGPAPVIKINDPVVFTMPNGITVMVVENHKLPKVDASYTIDRGPSLEGKKAGVISIMGSMLNEGTKTMTKDQFDEAVEGMGSDVSVSAGGGYVSAMTRYFDKSFMLFADALKNPAMKQENFDKLKAQRITGLKSSEKSASAIAGRVFNALTWGKTTARGEFETEESIKGLTLDDVKKAYADNITPSRSYITFVGDITPTAAKALVTKAFGTWKGKALTYPVYPQLPNVAKTEINLIDVPTAVQTEMRVSNLISNPLSNPDYYALVLANQILGGGSEGKLFMNLREKHGFTYGSYSNVGNGRLQTTFVSSAQVRNEKVDSAVLEIFSEINNMRNGNFTNEELAIAKAKYNGSFALGMENPRTAATYATNILINKLPKDYYRTFLQKLNAVTKADIQRVANKYFSTGNSRIVLVGKAEVLKPALARLGYKINEFDKYANPVVATGLANTTTATTAPALTAQAVVDKYINVSGGKTALEKINSISGDVTMEMMGQQFSGVMKRMSPNKSMMEIKFQGMTAFKDVFDGEKGYQSQMGQKHDKGAEELAIYKDEKGLFNQLFYNTVGFKLESQGVVKVEGEDAYKLKVTGPSGNVSTEYYSVKTGLLIKNESTIKAQGQELLNTYLFSDYKKVGDIMLPMKTVQQVGGQEIPIMLSNVKINEGVTAADFQ